MATMFFRITHGREKILVTLTMIEIECRAREAFLAVTLFYRIRGSTVLKRSLGAVVAETVDAVVTARVACLPMTIGAPRFRTGAGKRAVGIEQGRLGGLGAHFIKLPP